MLHEFHGLVYATGICFIIRGQMLQNDPKGFQKTMSLIPDMTDLLARARADLRMGVPVVLGSDSGLLVLAVETLSAARLADVMALDL